MPRVALWPRCRQVDVVLASPRAPAGTALPCGPERGQCPMVQNLNSSGERKGLQSLEERGAEAEAEAEAIMLRGGGSRASAKPRRPHSHSQSRPRPPSPTAPSRRASGAAAAAAPEPKEPSVLEAPVVSSVEETSFTFEFKRGFKRAKKTVLPPMDAPRGEDNLREGFSNKSNAVPAKKEAPKQVEFTHCSPGIVARLMGLDTVPRPKKVLARCQSDTQCNLQRHISEGFQEVACASSGDQPCNVSSDDLPALKDVFEVTEMENMVMHEVLQPGSEEQYLRHLEADLEFVRQKFLDVKRLATDEGHRNSKEFSEALEILHSKKDAFLEIIEENRTAVSGFSGHILSQSGSHSSSDTGNTAAEELSEQEILCSMPDVCDGMFDRPEEFERFIPSMLFKETSVASVEQLAPNRSKSKSSSHRAQIVVLKPNLQRKSSTPVLSSQETSRYKQRRVTNSKPPHLSKQYSLPQENEVLEGEEGISTHKARKQTPKSGSSRRQSKEEYLAVDTDKRKVALASTSHDDTMTIYSNMHSAGPSVSRKARKHLSERWQMACQSGSENPIPKGITTLGEMLGLSDGDAPKETSHEGSSDPNFSRCNVREVPASPLGISSKDGWKTGIYYEDDSRGGMSRNFPRSKSLPASSTTSTKLSGRRQSTPTCRLPILKDILNTPTDESENAPIRKRSSIRNAKQRNGRAVVQLRKENMLPEKEIHVTSEKARHSICISDLSRASNIYTEKYPGDATRAEDQQKCDSSVQREDKKNSEGHLVQTLATSFPETNEVLSIQNQDIALKEGRSPPAEIEVSPDDTRATRSVSIASGESSECSSPTASSPQSSVEETSYSGIFKSINVDIQGLRAQLKMLKMEGQDDICGDYSDTLSTDECNNTYISTSQEAEEQLPMFKDEEDRDLCYVQDMLASVCDLPDYPEDWQVDSDVFLWLENKYSKLLLWSKSDRKLLFDLVNSTLADVTTPENSLHSKILMKCWAEIDHELLAENVWQMVQKQSNYGHFAFEDVQPLPLDHRSELQVIGMNIARMIHDDIIKDSIAEFLSQENLPC